MEDLLSKLSQYQFFNFLLAGAVLVVVLSKSTKIELISANEDIIATFFIYYFIGLVISRIGSIIVEPILKRIKIIEFAPYSEYLSAVKEDPKIDTLSQENNMYRTLISTFLVFVIIYTFSRHSSSLISGKSALTTYLLSLAAILLFTLAYRKQTSYITKRIEKTKGK